MKSTKKAKKAPKTAAQKEEDENYPTPMNLALAITKKVKEVVTDSQGVHNLSLLEPSAGAGNFLKAMRATWDDSVIQVVDPVKKNHLALAAIPNTVLNVNTFEYWVHNTRFEKPVLAVGNPPFSLAQKHLEYMFTFFPKGSFICFLLRFSFLGGRERNLKFWDFQGYSYLRNLIPITPRPSFVKGKNDNSEYGLFIWRVGIETMTPAQLLPAIVWEK